jgi:hypothetical protein
MYRGTITQSTKKFYNDLVAFMTKNPDLELNEESKAGIDSHDLNELW